MFRGENQKLIEASKNNIQNFVAINEEVFKDLDFYMYIVLFF